MTAAELRTGKHFRVLGLPQWFEVKSRAGDGVLVRPLEGESHTFSTQAGADVTISFRPRSFYISRETLVEVEP